MVKGQRQYRFREVFPCPECEALRSRRYDLATHLVRAHGLLEEVAKQRAAGVAKMYEEMTSKLYDVAPGSRYAKQVPGGEEK